MDKVVQEENRDVLYTKHIQKHNPSHLQALRRKQTQRTNKQLKHIEKANAGEQFRIDSNRRITQRQHQTQRNKLMDPATGSV